MHRVLLLLAVTVAGCSSISANYDYDTDADFSRLRKYGWHAPKKVGDLTDIDRKRIRAVVTEELGAKGMVFDEHAADFRIAMHGGTKTRVRVIDSGYRYSSGPWWGGHGVDVYQYEEGTLILDIVDAKSNELIWRGTATGVVNPDATPEQKEKQIREAVTKVLAHFPPE